MNSFIPMLAASATGQINFSNMTTNAQGLSTNGTNVATWIVTAVICLGVAMAIGGQMNKSDLVSKTGGGIVAVAIIAAFIAYGSGAAGAAMIG